MEVEVRIPLDLRRFTGDLGTVLATGENVGEIVHFLESAYEGFKSEILDDRDQLADSYAIRINDEDIRFLSGLNSELHEGDIVSIVPAKDPSF